MSRIALIFTGLFGLSKSIDVAQAYWQLTFLTTSRPVIYQRRVPRCPGLSTFRVCEHNERAISLNGC